MRAINHTITGAAVGALISNPWIALPAALLSHLVLDIIPHAGDQNVSKSSARFKIELLIDASLSASFLLAILILQPYNWPLLVACGVLGAAPDLLWFPYWVWELQGKPRKLDPVGRFLAWIQWSEKPWGYYVEGLWLIAAVTGFMYLSV